MHKVLMLKLQKHLSYRRSQARKLEEENRQLLAREAILQAFCQELTWLRHQECNAWAVLAGLDGEQQQQQQEGLMLASDTAQFSAEELLLLQQLQTKTTIHFVGACEPELPQALMQQQQEARPQLWCGTVGVGSTEPQCWQQQQQQQQQQQDQELPFAEGAAGAVAAAVCNSAVRRQHSGSSSDIIHISSDMSGSGPAPGAAGWPEGQQQEPTVAPDDDLLYFFRRSFAMPPYPGAADMSMQDVSKVYNEIVRELSLNLALHEAAQQQPAAAAACAGGANSWPPTDLTPWQNIRAAFDRLANKYVTLAQLQRGILMCVTVLANHADMSQPLLPEPSLEDHIRAVRQLGLSATQKQQIADGCAVFRQLLEPVLLGMRQLQLQQPGGNAAAGGSTAAGGSGSNSFSDSARVTAEHSGSTAAACGADSSSMHSATAAVAAVAACSISISMLSVEGYKMHREVLHQQEQRTAQLKQLMQKDVLIKLAANAYYMGRCTYTQLAKLFVLMYPRQPSVAAIGQAVDAIIKEDQAQQGAKPRAKQ
uniref:Uncharacterized protein n=1 Tax=Tetradesmus obliquus TaxID=3088 RepID=A0A383VV39_TETOB|eukprot:jgi/Sobl393_1/6926/SZX69347.1